MNFRLIAQIALQSLIGPVALVLLSYYEPLLIEFRIAHAFLFFIIFFLMLLHDKRKIVFGNDKSKDD